MTSTPSNDINLMPSVDEVRDDNKNERKNIMKSSKLNTIPILVCGAFSSFLHGSRTTIWIPYAITFNDSSIYLIGIVMLIDAWLMGATGLGISILGQKIGYDTSTVVLLLLITIGCATEAFATNFVTLSIGFLISQTALFHISLAYVSWILPLKYASKYVSYLYALFAFGNLLGSIYGGILSNSFNYKITFITHLIASSLVTIYVSIFFVNKQQSLQDRQ
eukprot:131428_1